MDEYCEPSTTYNSDTAETETFSSDSEEILQRCDICKLFEPHLVLVEDTESVFLVKNVMWLKCHICFKFYHLSCIETFYNLDDILFFIEQNYTCTQCTHN